MPKEKSKTKKVVIFVVLALVIGILLLMGLNHPVVLEFSQKNPVTKAITGVAGGIVDAILGEVEGEPGEIELTLISGADLEECLDECDADKWNCYDDCSGLEEDEQEDCFDNCDDIHEDCQEACEDEVIVETCVLEEGTVVDDVGTFWNTCFPEWTARHEWTCRFLYLGTWYQTEDRLGCDGRICWVGCDWETYLHAQTVCEQIGGTWTCDSAFGGCYYCEI